MCNELLLVVPRIVGMKSTRSTTSFMDREVGKVSNPSSEGASN